MNEFLDNIQSFDIETSGTNPSKNFIWSMGITSGNSKSSAEYFVNEKNKTKFGLLKDLVSDGGEFAKKQYASGSFSALLDNLDNAGSLSSGIHNIFDKIDRSSVILIQNANFENKFINKALETLSPEESASIRDKMRFFSYTDSNMTKESNRILFTPPAVTEMRDTSAKLIRDYQRTSNRGEFDKAVGVYDKMMSEYTKMASDASKGKGAVVVDLMDVTKATYAKGASEGLLNKRSVGVGISVDFLSKALFDTAESHTALDDANMQKRIFERMSNIYSELKSGSVSEETIRDLSRIKAGQRIETTNQFLKAIDNALSEIDSDGSTRINLDSYRQVSGHKVAVTVHDRSGNPTNISRPDYRKLNGAAIGYESYSTSDKKVAIEDVIRRYSGQKLEGVNTSTFADDLLSGAISTESLKKELVFSEATSDGAGKRILDNIREDASDQYRRAAGIVDGWSNKKKIGIAAAAATAITAGMFASGSKEESQDYKRVAEENKKAKSVESQMRIFDEPIVYHGTGLANWNERTGHHRY